MIITKAMQTLKGRKRDALIVRADTVFSLYVRRRDGFRCFTCGRIGAEGDGVMECGHLFTRARESVRFDELNGHCQCKPCNDRHEKHPEIYQFKFMLRYGRDAYADLVKRSWSKEKITSGGLEEIIKKYEGMI
jgi:hypothetical protein